MGKIVLTPQDVAANVANGEINLSEGQSAIALDSSGKIAVITKLEGLNVVKYLKFEDEAASEYYNSNEGIGGENL
jgi:hypothetical protein